MTRITRAVSSCAFALLTACESPVSLSDTGELGLNFVSASNRTSQIDEWQVRVIGPSNRTVTLAPGATDTITGLTPGSYTVAVEGLVNMAVDEFFQITGITVAAGNYTNVQVLPDAFHTTLNPPTSPTIERQIAVSFASVPGAESYELQWDESANFLTPTSVAISVTSTTVNFPAPGQYYLKVRAINAYGSLGTWSPSRSVIVVTGQLVFIEQPTSTEAGLAITPAVKVAIQDGQGTTVTSANRDVTVSLAANPGAGTLSGTTTKPTVNGVATFDDIRVDKAASGYTLSAVANDVSEATSSSFGVSPTTPDNLVLGTQPGDTEAGLTIAPAVEVQIQDRFGNLVTTASNTISAALGVNPGKGTLSSTPKDAVAGVASFDDLSIDSTGAGYTLEFSATGLSSVETNPFDVYFYFVSISAGGSHSCGITSSGIGYCWGDNAYGQLGDATNFPSLTPKRVRMDGLSFDSITAGENHTCAWKIDGQTYCWGYNQYGQLGETTVTHRNSPRLVFGDHKFATVRAGGNHTCGVTTTEELFCWGHNLKGQVGNGMNTNDEREPRLISASFASASAGIWQHTCAVTVSGAGYCWGYNFDGELGDGTDVDKNTPEPVTGGLGFTAISAGGAHTCGVTVDGTNDAYCWGYGDDGQRGDGTNNQFELSPVIVVDVSSFISIDSGFDHTCGIVSGNIAYCWGLNGGALGNGDVLDSNRPAAVAGGNAFSIVSAGLRHTCGITTEDVALCWGVNAAGQLGDGTTAGRLSPTEVAVP